MMADLLVKRPISPDRLSLRGQESLEQVNFIHDWLATLLKRVGCFVNLSKIIISKILFFLYLLVIKCETVSDYNNPSWTSVKETPGEANKYQD